MLCAALCAPSYSVEEDVGVFELVIERQQGVVGDVSVIYFVTNEGAVNGPSEDFLVEQLVVSTDTHSTGQSDIYKHKLMEKTDVMLHMLSVLNITSQLEMF